MPAEESQSKTSSNRRLRLSPDAEDDLRDILQYTLESWGQIQHDKYAERLDRGMATLLAFPKVGRLRPELGAGARGFVVGQHLLVYRLKRNGVDVLRILSSGWDTAIRSRG